MNSQHTLDTPLLLFAGDRIEDTRATSSRLASLLRLCATLDALLGRRTLVSDLTEENWLPFLQAIQSIEGSTETVRRARGMLQTVWRQAVEAGLVTMADPKLIGFVSNVPSAAIHEQPPAPDGQVSLAKVCEEYFPLRSSITSEKTRYQYRRAVQSFGEYLGRTPTLDDLSDDVLTAWMVCLMGTGISIYTIRERVGRLQTLWTWCAKRHLVKRFPTVTRPHAPDPLPKALSEDQIRRLFASAAKERKDIAGIPSGLWWQSFFAFVWNTSERKSACLSVRVEWIDFANAVVTIPASVRKGKRKYGVYELWPETLPLLRAAIDADPKRELMWPWELNEGSYYTHYNRILEGAKIPVNRKTKTHGLRCSHATWLKVAGGDPTAQLGHGDVATTIRHYLDPALTRTRQPKLFIPWQAAEQKGPAA